MHFSHLRHTLQMYTAHTHTYGKLFPWGSTHRALIHYRAAGRSTCKSGLNNHTHSFVCEKRSPFPTEPLMIAGSVCLEAPGVPSDAHRLPGSSEAVWGNSERRGRNAWRKQQAPQKCSGLERRETDGKTEVTIHRWGNLTRQLPSSMFRIHSTVDFFRFQTLQHRAKPTPFLF